MLISTLNCEIWPNSSYRGVRSVQLLLLLLLLMVFSSENFGFSPPYAGIAGIGPGGIGKEKTKFGFHLGRLSTDDEIDQGQVYLAQATSSSESVEKEPFLNLGFWHTRILIDQESSGVATTMDWWSVKRKGVWGLAPKSIF